jgi:hypothetical protein
MVVSGSMRSNVIVVPGNHDVDISFWLPPGNVTTNYDSLLTRLRDLRTLRREAPQLRVCETIVALIAPKGRIEEFLGDHRDELHSLVCEFGTVRGAWICRGRLAGTVVRMLPAIVVRAMFLWKLKH